MKRYLLILFAVLLLIARCNNNCTDGEYRCKNNAVERCECSHDPLCDDDDNCEDCGWNKKNDCGEDNKVCRTHNGEANCSLTD